MASALSWRIPSSTTSTQSIAHLQPRLDHVSTETIDRDELMDWGVFQVKPRAEEAHNGPGEYRAGDWCQFCRAKGRCQAQAKQMLDGVQPLPGSRTHA